MQYNAKSSLSFHFLQSLDKHVDMQTINGILRLLFVIFASLRVLTSPVLLEASYSGIKGAWGGLEGSVDDLLGWGLVGFVCTLGGSVLVAEGFC